ncbi:MAG: hypothetical protein WC609_02635 [Candidatus Paceibacterota bacterium]|jgi:adenylylsulfate kinase-like enzyme
MKKEIHLLILTGSTGVGKSSTADAISRILTKKSINNAVIDLDYLRYAYPRPKSDPFHTKLGYKNLASVWKNYKKVGVTHFIIPNVVEQKKDLENIKLAISNDANIQVVFLKANVKIIHSRLKNRTKDESLQWHLDRAIVLSKKLEHAHVENFFVNTENKPINKVAEEIISKTGWAV